MEKRLPLALFLSFLVLFVWIQLTQKPETETDPAGEGGTEVTGGDDPAPGTTGDTTPADDQEAPPPAETPEPSIAGAVDEEFIVDTWVDDSANGDAHPGRFHLVFSNRGARLVSAKFRDYYVRVGLDEEAKAHEENWLTLVEAVPQQKGATGSLLLETMRLDTPLSSYDLAPGGLDDVLWEGKKLTGPERGVEFTYGPGNGVVFTKRITAVPDSWHLRMQLTIENGGGEKYAGKRKFLLTPAGCMPAELGDRFYTEPRAVAVGRDSDGDFEMDWESAAGADEGGGDFDTGSEGLVFVGAHNKYFAFFLRDADPVGRSLGGARYWPVVEYQEEFTGEDPEEFVEAKVLLSLEVPERGKRTWEYKVFAGPKDPDILVGDHEAHQLVLDKDLSTFSTIGKFLLLIMGFFHGLVGNWGVAIILLTLCVRAVLFPLNRRSQTSMARYQKKMKRVQPLIEEAKKRHANDPQKLREAQAKIMQEEGAFPPLGGCLPIFLQIPIFFGLFSALRTSFDLRQAPFMGWIDDLSRPDRLFTLGLDTPLVDLTYFNLLPLLMVVLWIWQQRGMPQPQDEQAKRMQKMMMFMPVVFGFLLYNYAAGLSVYMITQSSLGIVEQKFIKKMWPIDDTEVEKKKKDKPGCGPFSGIMQNFAEKQREQARQVEAMRSAKRAQTKKQRKKRKR